MNPTVFPIGLYGVSSPRDLGAIHHAGFNTVVPALADPVTLKAFGEAASMEGIALLVAPPSASPFTPAFPLPSSSFPVLAWYLADEPDVTGMTEDQLVERDRRVKKELPGPPTAFVVGDGGDALCYARAGDILMVDWYPVPHLPITSVGDHVRWTVDAARGRPVWAVLQAYDWRDQAQRNPNVPRIGRFPSSAEIRFMSYLALVRGARGLFYFTFTKPGGKTLLDFPDQWFALTRVVHELFGLSTVLAHGAPLVARPDAAPGFTARAWRDLASREEVVVLVNESADHAATVPPLLRQDRWMPVGNDPQPGELVAPLSVAVLRRTLPAQAVQPPQTNPLQDALQEFQKTHQPPPAHPSTGRSRGTDVTAQGGKAQ